MNHHGFCHADQYLGKEEIEALIFLFFFFDGCGRVCLGLSQIYAKFLDVF